MEDILYILFILVFILLVGGRSFKAVKAIQKEFSDLENAPVKSSSAFESLFATEKPRQSSFADEEKKAGYFTYETDDSSSETSYSPNVTRPVMPQTSREEAETAPSFDLRQAIVYNAILTPKYLSEVGYVDN